MMGAAKHGLDEDHLHHFSPINQLRPELLDELLSASTIERLPPGRRLFSEEEADSRSLFLLSGQLALVADGHPAGTLKADSREAAHPIDDHRPHQYTALARTSVTILSVDSAKLDELLTRNSAPPPKAKPVPTRTAQHDHLARIFESPLFSRLPKPHLQVLRNRMMEIEAKAGDVIIHEGDDSDYYYIIVSGRCSATRQLSRYGHKVTLADLAAGEGFGEGALIANDYHENTVTMLEDGRLLRFSKGEFLTLLVRPYIKWITYDAMIDLQAGGAILLDVRSPEVFHKAHVKGSVNFPLRIMRQTAFILDKAKEYIICCDAGRRSATAAFLLAQQGMEVKILGDGIRKALEREQSVGAPAGKSSS